MDSGGYEGVGFRHRGVVFEVLDGCVRADCGDNPLRMEGEKANPAF